MVIPKSFQSTRPVWGATLFSSRLEYRRINFNPRAPCGARLIEGFEVLVLGGISIHAPRVGRDAKVQVVILSEMLFQSTRPVWGATSCHDSILILLRISIHAPRVGRDREQMEGVIETKISIHAPRVGRDSSPWGR